MDAATDPHRGRAHARLLDHLETLDRLADVDRGSGEERIERALGPELAHKLVFALCGRGRRSFSRPPDGLGVAA